jgi:ATP-dependent Zn protease
MKVRRMSNDEQGSQGADDGGARGSSEVTPNLRDERRCVAVHEAGHAVLAVLLGVPITSVTIRPNAASGSLGDTKHSLAWLQTILQASEEGDSGEELVVAVRGIIVGLAGRLAEECIIGQSGPEAQYSHDEDGITELVSRVCGDHEEGDAFCKWLTVRARNMVVARRTDIERVADRLLDQETMSGEALDAVIFPPSPVVVRS